MKFYLSDCLNDEVKNKWRILKTLCEFGDNKEVVDEWLQYCHMENNICSLFVNTLEGGILLQNKDLVKFRYCLSGLQKDNYIILNYFVINNILIDTDEINETIMDLMDGFVNMANKRIGGEYVKRKMNASKLNIIDETSDSE